MTKMVGNVYRMCQKRKRRPQAVDDALYVNPPIFTPFPLRPLFDMPRTKKKSAEALEDAPTPPFILSSSPSVERVRANTHTNTLTHAHTHAQILTHTHGHTHTYTSTHTRTHTHAHKYTHTLAHTHIHSAWMYS